MSEEHVQRKIQVLKQEPKFNEVLRLRRLPPRGPQQQQGVRQGEQQGAAQQDPPASKESDGQQPSTSAEGGPTP